MGEAELRRAMALEVDWPLVLYKLAARRGCAVECLRAELEMDQRRLRVVMSGKDEPRWSEAIRILDAGADCFTALDWAAVRGELDGAWCPDATGHQAITQH